MFPTLLYKSPGPHRLAGGKTYGYIGCPDAEAFAKLTDEGWFATREEALAGKHAEEIVEAVQEASEAIEDAIDEVTPATRDELEQQAKELGIKFNARTTDAKLLERIDEALA